MRLRDAFLARAARLAPLIAACAVTPALAGPPFATDDPEPTDTGHFEIYLYSEGTHAEDGTEGTLPGLEVNYGAAPNLQISIAVPLAFDKGEKHGTLYSYGATEIGAKYRFVEEDDHGWRPQIAFYPSAEIPIGDADRKVGGGHVREFFPLWLQKSCGPWTTFGGGGYWINPGDGNKDYWFAGWALLRRVTQRFSLGAEVFHQTSDTRTSPDSTGANMGAVYDLSNRWHLVGSAGTGVTHRKSTNEFTYYAALEWTP